MSLFVQSLNQMIDSDAERQDALDNRIPMVVWYTLGLISLLACFVTGYLQRRRWKLAGLVLSLAIAAALALIADLDSSHGGLIRVSQQSMEHLSEQLNQPALPITAQTGH